MGSVPGWGTKMLHVLQRSLAVGFPCGSAGKESTGNVGNLGSIPRLGRSSGEGNSHPLQCSGLESWIRLSGFHFQLSPQYSRVTWLAQKSPAGKGQESERLVMNFHLVTYWCKSEYS